MNNENLYLPKRRVGLFIFIAAVVVIALAIGFVLRQKQKSELKVFGNTFMTALVQPDAQTTYDMLSENLKQGEDTLEGWSENLALALGGKEATFELEHVGIWPSRVSYLVSLNDGKSFSMHLVVVKEKDALKIGEYNTQEQ